MAFNVCPAAVVDAPVKVVWELLTNPNQYGWMDGRVIRIDPEGKATAGQTVTLRVSGLKVTLVVLEVDEHAKRIGLRFNLPFGMAVEPHISCAPLDAATCRVQYG